MGKGTWEHDCVNAEYAWDKCAQESLCECECVSPGSREAKLRLTSSSWPWVCMCLLLCEVSLLVMRPMSLEKAAMCVYVWGYKTHQSSKARTISGLVGCYKETDSHKAVSHMFVFLFFSIKIIVFDTHINPQSKPSVGLLRPPGWQNKMLGFFSNFVDINLLWCHSVDQICRSIVAVYLLQVTPAMRLQYASCAKLDKVAAIRSVNLQVLNKRTEPHNNATQHPHSK